MPEVASTDDGGSDITSYNLEWDSGTGNTFTEVVGYSSDNLVLIATETGLTAGSLYKFRYRVKNIYGYSGYSPEVSIYSAKVPDAPGQPTVNANGLNVDIDWSAPSANSNAITAYKIEIKTSDGTTWSQDLVNCDGTSSTITTNTACSIPFTYLTMSPFYLTLNSPIYVRVYAKNAIGYSDASTASDGTTLVQTIPPKPSAPTRGGLTSTTQIDVEWSLLSTNSETGGSTITSYNLIYDAGTANATWSEVIGYSSAYTGSYYVKTGLTMGTSYKFAYRA